MIKKMQLKVAVWAMNQMKKRQEKPHKKLNSCNDCDAVEIPLYQVSVLNLIVYVVIGVIIGFGWNAWLGFGVAFIATIMTFVLAKPQCAECRSTNIQVHTEPKPSKFEANVSAVDQALAKNSVVEPSEEEIEKARIDKELAEIEAEVTKLISK